MSGSEERGSSPQQLLTVHCHVPISFSATTPPGCQAEEDNKKNKNNLLFLVFYSEIFNSIFKQTINR